ncbi:hypothetical protein Val02_00420 [Virgisporangium aliadipatigenens]|uniref:Uncharacterized protein n=1 Tax=Virgisporangium aliadipatigenens TaxID=741659 RepID=A0A8J3YDU6_9ACTN|nr:hypothetical protein Val02_00420 [Virgisporangium aliadipatigenens]
MIPARHPFTRAAGFRPRGGDSSIVRTAVLPYVGLLPVSLLLIRVVAPLAAGPRR